MTQHYVLLLLISRVAQVPENQFNGTEDAVPFEAGVIRDDDESTRVLIAVVCSCLGICILIASLVVCWHWHRSRQLLRDLPIIDADFPAEVEIPALVEYRFPHVVEEHQNPLDRSFTPSALVASEVPIPASKLVPAEGNSPDVIRSVVFETFGSLSPDTTWVSPPSDLEDTVLLKDIDSMPTSSPHRSRGAFNQPSTIYGTPRRIDAFEVPQHSSHRAMTAHISRHIRGLGQVGSPERPVAHWDLHASPSGSFDDTELSYRHPHLHTLARTYSHF